MGTFSTILLAIFIVWLQYFLSRRSQAFFGAIIPICFTALMWGWVFKSPNLEDTASFYKILIFGNVIFLSEWANGRYAWKKKKKRELDKMTAQDMN